MRNQEDEFEKIHEEHRAHIEVSVSLHEAELLRLREDVEQELEHIHVEALNEQRDNLKEQHQQDMEAVAVDHEEEVKQVQEQLSSRVQEVRDQLTRTHASEMQEVRDYWQNCQEEREEPRRLSIQEQLSAEIEEDLPEEQHLMEAIDSVDAVKKDLSLDYYGELD